MTGGYIPGVCNIGEEEINKRRKMLFASLISSIILTWFCFKQPDSTWIKDVLFTSFTILVITIVEVRKRFCITFGAFGYFNFNKLGKAERVINKKLLVKDRLNALKILLFSILLSLTFIWLVSLMSNPC